MHNIVYYQCNMTCLAVLIVNLHVYTNIQHFIFH